MPTEVISVGHGFRGNFGWIVEAFLLPEGDQ